MGRGGSFPIEAIWIAEDSWNGIRTALIAATLLLSAGCAQHEPRGSGDLGVIVERSAGRLQVVDTTRQKSIGAIAGLRDLSHASVVYSRDGRYALASLWEMDGALIVFDAESLKEVKRIPMKKPSGKYNVYNKITRSEGTSH